MGSSFFPVGNNVTLQLFMLLNQYQVIGHNTTQARTTMSCPFFTLLAPLAFTLETVSQGWSKIPSTPLALSDGL